MAQATSYEIVTIKYEHNKLTVDKPLVELKASEDKGVQWEKGADVDKFDVCFSKSPFDDVYYNQDKPRSSAPNRDRLPKDLLVEYYKYSVQVGPEILDPGIIIR